MKACNLVAPGQYEVVDVKKPELQEGEILVRTHTVAICGSDLHFFRGRPHPNEYPFIPGYPGHEVVGTIEQSTGGPWRPGDTGLVIPPQEDAYAEYVTVPVTQFVPLPAGVPLEQFTLAQQLGTVLFSCRRIGGLIDKVVVILGQGPAGLMFTMLARVMGARFIIGIDIVPHLLDLAQSMGAHAVVNAAQEDPGMAVARLTGGDLANVAIEAVGKPKTIDSLPGLVRVGGQMAFYGIPPLGPISIDFERFFRRYAQTVTTAGAPKELGFHSFRLAIDMIQHGTIDIKPLISHILPLDQVQKAFTLANSKKEGAVKVLLDMTGS